MPITQTSNPFPVIANNATSGATTARSAQKNELGIEAALAAADLALIWIATAIALHVRLPGEMLRSFRGLHRGDAISIGIVSNYVSVFLLYSLFVILFCNQRGLHRRLQLLPLVNELISVVQAVSIATVVLTGFIYIAGANVVSRIAFGIAVSLTYVELMIWRVARRKWFEAQVRAGIESRNAVIVGAGIVGRALHRYLVANRQWGLVVVGFVDADLVGVAPVENEACALGGILGGPDDVQNIFRRHFVDEVFITVPEKRELVMNIAREAKAAGIDVRVIPDMYDGLAWGAPIQHFGLFPTVALNTKAIATLGLVVKRAMDLVVSGVGLLFLSPLLAVVALAVRLDSPGPILYRSERIGRKGRSFVFFKFRTMVNNAEILKEHIVHLNERRDALFKVRNDPRVTNVGRFLRKYSLDELPQLWNVIKGDMSLVGPRPPVPGEYCEYELAHLKRLDVTPGITGLWQVEARQNPSFETYISLDTEYVEYWSLWLDCKILAKTVLVVLAGTGW